MAPFSLQDATVGRAFLASEVEQRILALRMTLPMMSTAPLKTMTAEETLCLYHTDMESVATATSARPAVPPGGCGHLCCPWRLQGGTQDSIKGKKLVGGGGGYDLLLLEKRQRWGGWKDGLPAPVITPALPATVSQHTAHGQAQYILWE